MVFKVAFNPNLTFLPCFALPRLVLGRGRSGIVNGGCLLRYYVCYREYSHESCMNATVFGCSCPLQCLLHDLSIVTCLLTPQPNFSLGIRPGVDESGDVSKISKPS
ncbi:hypothetical protein F4813DRAFT_135519 [Daldinia decipiens]|uniref:uncharacterized protein n=1 Tax=Daldinia decipiens TaxID=326647 RepID=UPI0020C53729|nr:uncharacterized protein F4813DRAFT_135519 [Daldinia decipiens]KAI1656152.1 hypothetical protein F4813DRAFT_135519 [Daldinia decipiens]